MSRRDAHLDIGNQYTHEEYGTVTVEKVVLEQTEGGITITVDETEECVLETQGTFTEYVYFTPEHNEEALVKEPAAQFIFSVDAPEYHE